MASKSKETCPVCHDDIEIWAIGQCDHPICYKCSSRMRVLCEQQYCAICRSDLPKVIFKERIASYAKINTQTFLLSRKHQIYFQNIDIQNAFFDLISHKCKFCRGMKALNTFPQLETHMKREHSLYYCDLCVKHLKVFSWERKAYDRERLARHRRIGDEDDKSLKGHPLCELCDQRFLDKDELVRHCRKEHFFCHFCETDGLKIIFFGDYYLLRDHFFEQHYLCEEADCLHAKFTNAFRSEIDLKAHKATVHSKMMKKSEARQARTIEMDFSFAPRPGMMGRGGRNKYQRNRDRDQGEERHGRGQENNDRQRYQEREERRNDYRKQRDALETAQAVVSSLNEIQRQSGAIAVVDPSLINAGILNTLRSESPKDQAYERKTEDFPTLGGKIVPRSSTDSGDDSDSNKQRAKHHKDSLAKKVAHANLLSVQHGDMLDGDFPTLGGKTSKAPGSTAKSAWASKPEDADYPSLPAKKKKEKPTPGPVVSTKTSSFTPSWAQSSPQSTKPSLAQTTKPSSSRQETSKAVYSQANKSKVSSKSTTSPSPGSLFYQDLPSLSSIGNSLLPFAGPPAPGLSSTRLSNQPTLNIIDKAPDMSSEPPPPKAPPPNFRKDDFPTLGNRAPASSSISNWGSTKQKKPKVETKQKKDASKPQKLTKQPSDHKPEPEQTELQKPEPKKTDEWQHWQELKPQKSSKVAAEEKQGKDLENFVSRQTKSKAKKKKKEKISPESSETPSLETSDKDSDTDFRMANKQPVEKMDVKSKNKKAKKLENSTDVKLIQDEKSGNMESKDTITSQEKVQSEKIEAKSSIGALQPKMDNFPSLSELSMSIPTPAVQPSLAFADDDFPSLGSTATMPKPPPGFGASNDTSTSSSRPPPGFGAAATSAKPPPGFQTNHCENIENIAPLITNGNIVHYAYAQPENFRERNQKLIRDIQMMLTSSQFDRFKTYSGDFRQNQISSSEYYDICCSIMGRDNFLKIFPELLALLPDIEKQNELLQTHILSQKQPKDIVRISETGKRCWQSNSVPVSSCSICSQVVLNSELHNHKLEHNIDLDFPSLGASLSNTIASSWVKK